MKIILTHNNADFDAVASMLAAHKLDPHSQPVLPSRMLRSVAEFLALYRNGLPFISQEDFHPEETVKHITLTDTQTYPEMANIPDDLPTLIIEHHAQERRLRPNETWIGEEVGATTTLLVEQLKDRRISINSLEATLLMLGIYADTGMLTYGGTTPRDIQAAAWLLEKGAALDTVRRFMHAPLDDNQQRLLEILLRQQENRRLQGYDVIICTAQVDEHVSGINVVCTQLRDILDPAALFTVVALPKLIQVVARSADDAIDVGEVARLLGGGGHPRAAAAAVYSKDTGEVTSAIWEILTDHIQPPVRVADLMSKGVHTVKADDRISDIIGRIRRIGHEGYPVMSDGKVVGLLSLREADRALEHELDDVRVGDLMRAGTITLTPHDSVMRLEQLMVETGWGQIPVEINGQVGGIVTRTDLIKHWAQTHPSSSPSQSTLPPERLRTLLGEDVEKLVLSLADHAQDENKNLYLVGGVVRDLLLMQANNDIDFVVEGDAIAFAKSIQKGIGGRLHMHEPFGTAKWQPDARITKTLGIDLSKLPDHIDFATARNEFYTHPTALPTVYSGSIKLDLGRRDFTINTLAVQLSPSEAQWRIVDYYGGLSDLEQRYIRVLHSLSFIDDPTRIIRAVRFAERLRFKIEPRTEELIGRALPMLRRITGERIRNEITLLLREEKPERGISYLRRLRAFEAIHPAFEVDSEIGQRFKLARENVESEDKSTLFDIYWHMLFCRLDKTAVQAVAERLLFGQNMIRELRATSKLINDLERLKQPDIRPSQAVAILETLPVMSLRVGHLLLDAPAKEYLEQYNKEWRYLQPTITGHNIKEFGLSAGPAYKRILTQIRNAWLDGVITNTVEENALLQSLVEIEQKGTDHG